MIDAQSESFLNTLHLVRHTTYMEVGIDVLREVTSIKEQIQENKSKDGCYIVITCFKESHPCPRIRETTIRSSAS